MTATNSGRSEATTHMAEEAGSEPSGFFTPTVADYNKLARENVDLRDEMATMRAEFAETQERWTRMIAEVRLGNAVAYPEVTDEVYEDSYKVLQLLKDRCWNEGYLEGLNASRNAIEKFERQEKESITGGDPNAL